jgi:hypothetical protein
MALGAECPNELVRAESNVNPVTGAPYSTELPDCRAYELVSPPEAGGAQVPAPLEVETDSGTRRVEIAADGSVFFMSQATPAGTGAIERGEYDDVFRSQRTGNGWVTRDLTAFGVAPGAIFLKAASADGSRILIETALSLSSADVNNPSGNVTNGFDLYLLGEGGPPQLVTQGEVPNATPGQDSITPGSTPITNAELSAVGFTSTASLQPVEGSAGSSAGCYLWANVESHLAYLTNPEGPSAQNCTYLGVAPDGRAIVEDTSGDSRTGLIFASAGAQQFSSEHTVQLSGDTPFVAKFDALSPGGQVAYITSSDKLDPAYENAGKPSVYAVSMTTGAVKGGGAQCVSCAGGSDDEGLQYVGQSADGSHVYFSTVQGLWSWDEQGGEATMLTTATDVSQVISSRNGQFVAGLTSQLTPHGAPDVYEFFADGHAPALVASGESGDQYMLVGATRGVSGGVSDDGQRVVYEDDPTSGDLTIKEWAAGHTTQISPIGASYPDELMGILGDELEDVFFQAHEPLDGQDLNAGTGDIYDARIDGGFPAPTVPVSYNQTENPTAATTTAFTPNLAPPSIQLAPLSADTSHPASPSAAKPPTRAQKLAKALKACSKRHNRRSREACERNARKRYALAKNGKKVK